MVFQYLISYASGLFHGSQQNWAVLTKKAYAVVSEDLLHKDTLNAKVKTR